LEVAANGGRVRFTRDVGSIVMDLGGVERLGIRALGGADKVTVDNLTGNDMVSVLADLNATGGGGDDGAATTWWSTPRPTATRRIRLRLGRQRAGLRPGPAD
jgi:hypothetical protein